MTPPAPPMARSPWLEPSKNAHGVLLSITGAMVVLCFPISGVILCSWDFCNSSAEVMLMGVHMFLKIALFLASHIVKTKITGKALNSHTALLSYHCLLFFSHESSLLIMLPLLRFLEASIQTCSAYEQVPNKWEVSSTSFLHKMQIPGPCKPLFLRFSHVNNLLFIASQKVRMVFIGLLHSHIPFHH